MQTILIEETYTLWHRILGFMLEKLLTPLGLQVLTDHAIMSGPLQADVVIIRRDTDFWTAEQQLRMCDGMRDSRASDVILEFKYTESANRDAFQQALGYDITYRRKNEYNTEKVETFLLSSRTPGQKILDALEYEPAEHPGVYRSQDLMMERVTLLVLNELTDEPHNAYVKIFASRKNSKAEARRILTDDVMPTLSHELQFMVTQLINFWFAENIVEGEIDMRELYKDYDAAAFMDEINMIIGLRNEMVEKGGLGPLVDVLEGNMMAAVSAERRMRDLSPSQRLQGLSVHDIVANVQPEELIREFKPEFIVTHYKPEELMSQLKPEDMEAYLQRLKESQNDEKSSEE